MLSAFRNLKLSIKLNLILVGILVSAIAACGIFLSRILETKIE